METVMQKEAKVFDTFKDEFGYSNVMAAPKLEKIVISVGTGKRAKNDRNFNELVAKTLTEITGQKPSLRAARVSIATFKLREGDPIGQMVTLRGERMYSFMDKLINIALPRTRDFRGIKRSGVDQMGNLTMGIKEHTIFPVSSEEELRNVFGMAITFVASTKTSEEGMKFFEHLGIPFKKENK